MERVEYSLLGTQQEPLYDFSLRVSRDSDVLVSVGGDDVLFVRGEEEGGDGGGVAWKGMKDEQRVSKSSEVREGGARVRGSTGGREGERRA